MTSKPAAPTGPAATAEIDRRLAALPADVRTVLQELRETIAAAAPDAVEAISYGMPAFRYHGRYLAAYLAAKAHCSLFPGAAPTEAHRSELAAFDVSKGTIRFSPDHPLPADLVTSIIRVRMADIDAAQAKPRR
jgi:uncharacterized protein YdhG (YjbR/CyaY superfamily)